jgi:hypothetical protein
MFECGEGKVSQRLTGCPRSRCEGVGRSPLNAGLPSTIGAPCNDEGLGPSPTYQDQREDLNDDLGVAAHRQGCARACGSVAVASTPSSCGDVRGAGDRTRTIDVVTAKTGRSRGDCSREP